MAKPRFANAGAAVRVAVMSKMMLSGRAGSPETPPTAGSELEAAR